MDFPWEFTIPVSGPWQERQSSAANASLDERSSASANTAYSPIERRLRRSLRIGLFGHGAWHCGFTVGLFAASDWGKLRILLRYFMTPRQFRPASATSIAVQVPQNSSPAECPVDIYAMSWETQRRPVARDLLTDSQCPRHALNVNPGFRPVSVRTRRYQSLSLFFSMTHLEHVITHFFHHR